MNTLYFGDNFEILCEMDSERVDLICTDPPFNSGRDYNAFFKDSKHRTKRLPIFGHGTTRTKKQKKPVRISRTLHTQTVILIPTGHWMNV